MAAPFTPPVSNIRKREVPKWVPPQPTRMDLDWADLHTIDLALLDSPDPDVVAKLIATTKEAIKEDGFLFLTNYGISLEQLHRQFDLAQYLQQNITEEKRNLLCDSSTGIFCRLQAPYGLEARGRQV
ncbi:hypothetical protein VTN00DRAFT_2772 [Thermoascus crustaceus]|uniref:uncharacterized protein n=1 Tax=Thermoascus crustaceus TaxID=5088 RepID=UPI0037437FE3